jgi:Flp pilus assembly protein TadD
MRKKTTAKRKLTRRELRALDYEIQFIKGIVRRDPAYIEALQILGANYTRRGDYEEGLRVDLQLARRRPDDPQVFYNLACSYSLVRKARRAAAALNRALDLGYRDRKTLLKDPDLAFLRQHALFKRIQERLRALPERLR